MKLYWFCILPMTLFLVSCGCQFCKKKCDCAGSGCEKSLSFIFSVDSTHNKSFIRSEIDTVIVRRYDKNSKQVKDSVILFMDTLYNSYIGAYSCGIYEFGFSIGQYGVFNGADINDFDFDIIVPGLRKYRLRNSNIEGFINDKGCCNCYRLNTKTVTLNNVGYSLAENDIPIKLYDK